jgi:hypothetical protein
MSTLHEQPPSLPGQPSRSPGLAVIAWLFLTSAIVPMAMAIRGEGRTPLAIGLGMCAVGAVLLVVARQRRRG